MKQESNDAVTLNEAGEIEKQLSIKETYHLLLRIMWMKPIRILAAVLLTVKAGSFENENELPSSRDMLTKEILIFRSQALRRATQ